MGRPSHIRATWVAKRGRCQQPHAEWQGWGMGSQPPTERYRRESGWGGTRPPINSLTNSISYRYLQRDSNNDHTMGSIMYLPIFGSNESNLRQLQGAGRYVDCRTCILHITQYMSILTRCQEGVSSHAHTLGTLTLVTTVYQLRCHVFAFTLAVFRLYLITGRPATSYPKQWGPSMEEQTNWRVYN